MPRQRKRSPSPAARKAQRAILFQLLRDDHHARWTRHELDHELSDITPSDIDDALRRLQHEGIAQTTDEVISATRCARYLDTLEVITI